jgi:DNA uptake protein ComE-like DNA-binding protein
MLTPTPQSESNYSWVWLSFLPVLGSLVIVYAGHKAKISRWMYCGIGIFITATITSSTSLSLPLWVFQIVLSFYLKNNFLVKSSLRGGEQSKSLASNYALSERRGKIDINSCSKDELVRDLGLPIVYANDIESLQNEGYVFTYLEELSEIAGLPESYLNQLKNHLVFNYDYRKDIDLSWHRVNILSVEELACLGIKQEVAEKIILERNSGGEYRSVIDIKRRTRIPFKMYKLIV